MEKPSRMRRLMNAERVVFFIWLSFRTELVTHYLSLVSRAL